MNQEVQDLLGSRGSTFEKRKWRNLAMVLAAAGTTWCFCRKQGETRTLMHSLSHPTEHGGNYLPPTPQGTGSESGFVYIAPFRLLRSAFLTVGWDRKACPSADVLHCETLHRRRWRQWLDQHGYPGHPTHPWFSGPGFLSGWGATGQGPCPSQAFS